MVRNSPQGTPRYLLGRAVRGSIFHPRKGRNHHPRRPGRRSSRVVWLAEESARSWSAVAFGRAHWPCTGARAGCSTLIRIALVRNGDNHMNTRILIRWAGVSAIVAGNFYVIVGMFHPLETLATVTIPQW